MTLDINSNGSYFYNGNNKKKNKDEESESDEKKDEKDENSSEKHTYQAKSADASSLEVLGMQNALMIHQESIVHNPHCQKNIVEVENDLNHSVDDNVHQHTSSSSGIGHSANLKDVDINNSVKPQKVESLNSNNEDILSKVSDYENLGIVKNKDGTFSVKNNPFGKFTKSTIEDYINKYIIPSLADAWINGYSKLYTVNSRKILLMKVTSKSGKKAFKGRIIENGVKYIIFYGVNDRGLPDENNIIKKLKIETPEQEHAE